PFGPELVEQTAERGVVFDGRTLGELEDEMAAMGGEERDHLMEAKLRLLEHLRFQVEKEFAIEQIDDFQAPQGALQGNRLQSPRQLGLASEGEEHVGVAEGAV